MAEGDAGARRVLNRPSASTSRPRRTRSNRMGEGAAGGGARARKGRTMKADFTLEQLSELVGVTVTGVSLPMGGGWNGAKLILEVDREPTVHVTEQESGLRRARELVAAEQLEDPNEDDEGDCAYRQAVNDCLGAIDAAIANLERG